MNVRVHYSKWSTIGSVLWMIFLFLTLIIMLSSLKGGSFGNILNKTFNPVDKGKVNITFADVMGNHEAKEDMMDLVEYLKNPDKFGNIKVPKGVLMAGPPGTGKTLLAKALAGEAGVPFIASSGSEFEEVFVGVGAKRIRTLFEEARKRAPCIIFIDEIDAVAGKRDLLKQSQMSLNQLLVELDGFNSRDGIIIIGATNRPETLDPAIVRPGRFDRKIFLSYPTIEERKEILDYYLKKHKIDEDVDPVTLSRQLAGMSGADIENMVNWAAMDTVKNDAPAITMHSLELALLNVVMGREKKTMVLSDKTKKITAYHEGGHALTALFTEGSPEIRKATLIPRGDALGMVNFLESDEMMVSKKEFLGRIAMAMGGRVAEELIFGADNVSSGASSDFQSATNIALMMVTKFGMSEKVGPVSISKDGFKGDGKVIEEEVRAILTSSYETAKSILTAKDKELHLIADALLKYETLDKDEILKVIQGEKLTEKEAKLKKEKEEMEEKKKKRLEAETKKAEEKKAEVEEETKQALEELKKGLSKHQIQVPEFPTILKTQIHQ
uniref:AAA+ ATPase domain-containing protein n=1 Tax=Arcella intermedia TaxID=1963864 RepID=A0A6B2L0R1_9EUKA